jgi:hypothetical protein
MKTEITKIKLQLKGREIELTIKEAGELYDELTKLAEISHGMKPSIPLAPWPVYPAPIVIERNVPYWPRPWEIWCGGTTGGMSDTGNHPGATLCIAVGQVS